MRESLEEAFSNYVNEKYHFPIQDSIPDLESARFGAKWQKEKMYSEEEVIELIKKFDCCVWTGYFIGPDIRKEWFEQFKKK